MSEDLTRDRIELKYLLLPDEVEGFLLDLRPAREDFSFRVDRCRITTVYFDRPDGKLARRALSGRGRAVKVRLREYFSAEDGASLPFVWIEVKEREGVTSRKTRFPLPKELVAPFFRGHVDVARILDGPDPVEVEGRVIEGVRRVRQVSRGGALVAVGAACCHRLAIEGGQPRARLTLDREIFFRLGAPDLYEAVSSLDFEAVGPASVEHAGAVAELKVRSFPAPAWCGRALRGRRPVEFSKFRVLSALAVSEERASRIPVENL